MAWPVKHGMYGTPEYNAWRKMLDRCFNPTTENFQHYGGRGITVCDEWKTSFENFFLHIGKRPSPKYCLDRIDNNGNYEPGNVRWTTKKESTNNRRTTLRVMFNGETRALSEWADILSIPYTLLCERITKRKWSPEKAFNFPIQEKGKTVEVNGVGKTLSEWSKVLHVEYATLHARMMRNRNHGRPDGWMLDRDLRIR